MDPSDWLAITQLLHRYVQLLDSGRKEGLAGCFTLDAYFDSRPNLDRPDFLFPVTGNEAIAEALHSRQQHWSDVSRVHQVTNSLITSEQPHRVEVTSSMVVLHRRDGEPAFTNIIGAYDDVLEKGDDGRWRIASRIVRRSSSGLPPMASSPRHP